MKKRNPTDPPRSLIDISNYYGYHPESVVAGSGNTSYKEPDRMWVKASGVPLAGIDRQGFVCLSRKELERIGSGHYSSDPAERAEQVKRDLRNAVVSPGNPRPSVETSLHNLIGYAFVIHTHPTLVNAMLCAKHAPEEVKKRFGEEALFMPFTDPGYALFKRLQEKIGAYRSRHHRDPRIIFLQNHGVFVGADTVGEVKEIYRLIEERIKQDEEMTLPGHDPVDYVSSTVRACREYVVPRSCKLKAIRSELVHHFTQEVSMFRKISRPVTPDHIIYCKSDFLFLESEMDGETVHRAIREYESDRGCLPRVLLEEGGGLMAVEASPESVQTVLEVFTNLMKISYLSEKFGGLHFLSDRQIRLIENWEAAH